MTKPLLIVFLGFPGSGKTYFARHLAEKIGAVTLNTDALRVSMFGSLEKIDEIRHKGDRSRLYDDVFGAMEITPRGRFYFRGIRWSMTPSKPNAKTAETLKKLLPNQGRFRYSYG